MSQKHRFGASSEKTDCEQLRLFNEAKAEAQPLLAEPTIEKITYQRRKQKGRREAIISNLPVVTVEYCLPVEEQVCPSCGGPLNKMGAEVHRELKTIPAQVKVVEHVRHVSSRRRCAQEEINTPVVTAPMPAPVIESSLASPSALAYIVTQNTLKACRSIARSSSPPVWE